MKYDRIPLPSQQELAPEDAPVEKQGPTQESEEERDERRLHMKILAEKLSQNPEPFLFSGIDPDEYERLKEDDQTVSGYYIPIDQRIERFQKEGVRVVVGQREGNNEIVVVPALTSTEEIKRYALFPRQLQSTPGMDEQFAELIQLNKLK